MGVEITFWAPVPPSRSEASDKISTTCHVPAQHAMTLRATEVAEPVLQPAVLQRSRSDASTVAAAAVSDPVESAAAPAPSRKREVCWAKNFSMVTLFSLQNDSQLTALALPDCSPRPSTRFRAGPYGSARRRRPLAAG